jgi:FkbH-like protein
VKYQELLKTNRDFEKSFLKLDFNAVILSNITTYQINEILEYYLRIDSIPASVISGNFNNIVQDSFKYSDSDLIIIFWELCDLIEGLYHKIDLFEEQQLESVFEKTCEEIALVISNLKKSSLVLFNTFSALPFTISNQTDNKFEKLSKRLNKHIIKTFPSNVKLINIDIIIAQLGIPQCLDFRFYYSSKALYTVDFFKRYAEFVKPIILSATGKTKKAIIFDCDNTLWKGVLGEDGIDGIDMSQKTMDGNIFSEVQSIALSLNKKGVIIGLCSKNNQHDVDEVLKKHPDMQLREEHINIKKIVWTDKVSSLRQISIELNIGLDSIVFVDDSTFETNLVKEQIPEVTVLTVPKKLHEYPSMLRENLGLFYNLSSTKEDQNKVEMYKDQNLRVKEKDNYKSLQDYLESLELQIKIFHNESSLIPRMSQMSQKTNQFNLTTKRYTENDITNYIKDKNVEVLSFSVVDKFGDSGVTGLCIVNIDPSEQLASIDSFLMSCRVIGRNIEFVFVDYLINYLKEKNIDHIKAKYILTKKNSQVELFWDNFYFSVVNHTSSNKNYVLNLDDYQPKDINYIDVLKG